MTCDGFVHHRGNGFLVFLRPIPNDKAGIDLAQHNNDLLVADCLTVSLMLSRL